MNLEKNTLTADRQAASELAKEVYDEGVTDLSEIGALDDAVQETYQIRAFSAEGNPVETIQVKNIGEETIKAMAVNSDTWQNTGEK